ncbi:endonuclease 4-like [Cryptomeria japonica]|uniref:endonuclease 4-like n=1 Tax=Cryptomeria japonica TaxID=3369 RepID=UPI0025AC25B4|nr:endonuclease 4-like [Cryptomeria japonica]
MMLLILLIFLAKAPATQSWGSEGHYITCKIAQPLLSEAAANAVQKLLPSSAEGDLASVCSWADTVRSIYPWSSSLHFANPPNVCNYDYTRDCHNTQGEKDMCVAGAINNYTSQLASYGDLSTAVPYNLAESLMFLSHLIGDIHQPLHLGFISDLGGNRITVQWYTEETNLHHVWDSKIINETLKEFYDLEVSAMIEDLQRNITGGWSDEVPTWDSCSKDSLSCIVRYASESISLACEWAYKDVTADAILGDDYFLSRLPIVEKRLAQGGVRLAATLNRIFSSGIDFSK